MWECLKDRNYDEVCAGRGPLPEGEGARLGHVTVIADHTVKLTAFRLSRLLRSLSQPLVPHLAS